MFRFILTICCLFPSLAWAEDTPAAIGEWRSVLTAEARMAGADDSLDGTCQAVIQAAERLRSAQAAYCEECLYLYADLYRPEQEAIDVMRAAFMQRVDECLRQDLRDIVTFTPWCRRDNHGFWLRSQADAPMWLSPTAPQQPRALTLLFAGRNHGTPAAARLAGTTAHNIHRDIVKVCADGIASLYNDALTYEPLTGAEPMGENIPVADLRQLKAAFDVAEQAWNEYCQAVASLISPQREADMTAQRLLSRLYATHLHYLTFISDGARSALNITRKSGTFQLGTGQQRYPFGEIFHDYALFFRHPALPGNPWCLTMSGPTSPDAEFTYTLVAPCPELETYATAHPEGGMVFVHGYFDVEVTGKPYEPVNRPADESGNIPDPRPADAYSVRTVLRVISLMPLKW